MSTVFLIYGLRDPRTNEIRYVGQSRRGLRRAQSHRHKYHLEKGWHTPKVKWLRELSSLGLRYEVVVLQYCPTADALNDAEREWVAIGRAALGNRLLNRTIGGDGAQGLLYTPPQRKRLSRAMRTCWSDPTRIEAQRDRCNARFSIEELLAHTARRLRQRAAAFVREQTPSTEYAVEYKTIRLKQDIVDRIVIELSRRPYRIYRDVALAVGCATSAVAAVNIVRRVRAKRAAG